MTLQERITQLEREMQQIQVQLQQWNEARLRTEGALIVLKNLATEGDEPEIPPQEKDVEALGEVS